MLGTELLVELEFAKSCARPFSPISSSSVFADVVYVRISCETREKIVCNPHLESNYPLTGTKANAA